MAKRCAYDFGWPVLLLVAASGAALLPSCGNLGRLNEVGASGREGVAGLPEPSQAREDLAIQLTGWSEAGTVALGAEGKTSRTVVGIDRGVPLSLFDWPRQDAATVDYGQLGVDLADASFGADLGVARSKKAAVRIFAEPRGLEADDPSRFAFRQFPLEPSWRTDGLERLWDTVGIDVAMPRTAIKLTGPVVGKFNGWWSGRGAAFPWWYSPSVIGLRRSRGAFSYLVRGYGISPTSQGQCFGSFDEFRYQDFDQAIRPDGLVAAVEMNSGDVGVEDSLWKVVIATEQEGRSLAHVFQVIPVCDASLFPTGIDRGSDEVPRAHKCLSLLDGADENSVFDLMVVPVPLEAHTFSRPTLADHARPARQALCVSLPCIARCRDKGSLFVVFRSEAGVDPSFVEGEFVLVAEQDLTTVLEPESEEEGDHKPCLVGQIVIGPPNGPR